MVILQLVRGHRLKLFAKRLELKPEFIERIDIHGMNYVQSINSIQAAPDYSRLIILAKMKDSDTPLPVTFLVHNYLMPGLIEEFQVIEEDVDTDHAG